MCQPLLWHDPPFRPYRLPDNLDPNTLEHEAPASQQPCAWACHGMVSKIVDEGAAAWRPCSCDGQRQTHAAPERKVHQIRRKCWQGQQGWRQAMPLHVGLLGSAATHGRWAEQLAAGHALGKKCEVREQHPVASHSPIYRARHALPATVLSAGTPPNLVAESSFDCLGARLQPLRPGGLVRHLIPGPEVLQAACSSFRAALLQHWQGVRPRRPVCCRGEALRMHEA